MPHVAAKYIKPYGLKKYFSLITAGIQWGSCMRFPWPWNPYLSSYIYSVSQFSEYVVLTTGIIGCYLNLFAYRLFPRLRPITRRPSTNHRNLKLINIFIFNIRIRSMVTWTCVLWSLNIHLNTDVCAESLRARFVCGIHVRGNDEEWKQRDATSGRRQSKIRSEKQRFFIFYPSPLSHRVSLGCLYRSKSPNSQIWDWIIDESPLIRKSFTRKYNIACGMELSRRRLKSLK